MNAQKIAHDIVTGAIVSWLNDVVGIWEYLETALPEGEWERMSLSEQERLVLAVEDWLRNYKEEWEK